MRPISREILVCTLVVLFASLLAMAQGTKAPIDNRAPSESEQDRPKERAKWFLRGRTVNGQPAARELDRAHQQKRENRRLHSLGSAANKTGTQSAITSEAPAPGSAAPTPSYEQSTGGPSWVPLGPAPTATAAFGSNVQDYGPAVGRATAVVVDQTDTSGNTVYVGGASGGLWKATDAGSFSPRSCNANGVCTASPTWVPLIDHEPTLTVGSIALQPGNNSLLLVGTGEANNSVDSYYGMGILRSTNGGANWTLVSKTADNVYDFHGLGFTHIDFSTDNPNIVVATAAAASGGITVGAETGGSNARGIYYSLDAGQRWSRANVWDAPGVSPSPGSANAVVYNSIEKKFYANIRYHGFYVSTDGVTFYRLGSSGAPANTKQPGTTLLGLSACPSVTSSTCPLYRAEMTVVPGRNEMYVWIIQTDPAGGNADVNQGIYQTLDGGVNWTTITSSGIATDQATYNLTLAAIPNGSGTDLYAGGVDQYKCAINSSNPTCGTRPFMNVTHAYACTPWGSQAHVHPDEHGIDFLGNDGTGLLLASKPTGFSPPVFFANDGGIYRVLRSDNLTSGSCPPSNTNPQSAFDNLSLTMGSMIQFVWFSQHPGDPTTLLGGTQDNGSPAKDGSAALSGSGYGYPFLSVNNGDGGFNDINPLSTNEWFTSNPAPFTSGSGIFRCTSAIACTNETFGNPAIDQAHLGGDNSPFYTNFMLDPQASGRMIVGTCRVWRGNSDGSGADWSVNSSGGNPLSYNFDSLSADACADTAVNMVTALAAGGPCNGTFCNGSPASPTGGGSQVVWAGTNGVADATSASTTCPNHLPCGGQVWVTTNADGGPSTWKRVDGAGQPNCTATPSSCNLNPKHYPISAVAIDAHDVTGRTAYVTVMGFNTGHVFKTTDAGGTWALLDGNAGGTGLPDNPADAVVVDPVTANLVYASTDVGVFRSTGDGTWTELGPGTAAGSLPNAVVTALKIYKNGSDVRLRASTYGRGLWEISTATTPGYSMTVSNPVVSVFPGQTATFNGALSVFFGYSTSVAITCGSGAPAPPTGSCTGQTVPAPGNFSVTASSSTVGDYSFNLVGVGNDPNHVQQQAPVTLQVSDFHLTVPPNSSTAPGFVANTSFDVVPDGSFSGIVTLSCTGMPTGVSCSFTPASVTLTPGVSVPVQLAISTSAPTPVGAQTVTVNAVAAGGWTHTQAAAFTVAATSFTMSAPNLAPSPAKPGQSLSTTINFGSVPVGAYSGTLRLSCAYDADAGSWGASTCTVNPSSVTLPPSPTATVTVSNPSGAPATNPKVIVTAVDTVTDASNSWSSVYSVIDYALVTGPPTLTVPGGSDSSASLTLSALNGYAGTVAVQCSAPSPLTCSLTPAGPYAIPGITTAKITAPPLCADSAAPCGGNYTVTVTSNDLAYTALTHSQAFTVTARDFGMRAATTTGTVKAGSSGSYTITIVPDAAGANGPVTLSCASGVPQLAGCQFGAGTASSITLDPAQGQLSTTLTITTTAPTVAAVPSRRRGTPLYALWMAMPSVAMVFISMGAAPRRQRSKLPGLIGLTLALAVIIMLPGCGGGGGGSTTTQPPVPKPGTPAGTYTIVVSGRSGSGGTTLTRSATVTLTVN